MKNPDWLWPVLLSASASLAGWMVVANINHPMRPLLAFWLAVFCPGLAIVRSLHLKDPFSEWTLAIALSLGLSTGIAEILVYAQAWSLQFVTLSLVAMSIAGAALNLYLDYVHRRPAVFIQLADIEESQP